MQRTVRITWHGHSCFTLDDGRHVLALDPYDPGMIGYPPLKIKAHAMLASHGHGDHNYRSAVQFLPASGEVLRQVAALPENGAASATSAAAASQPDSPYLYRTVETSHDETDGSKRGRNTVHVILANGLRIVHLGDLGHCLSAEQAAAIGRPDLLLIPVGGYYTIDAAAACAVINQLQPANIAPMHYQIGYGNLPIAKVESFLSLAAANWEIRKLAGPTLELTGQMCGLCCVFHYQAAI